MTTAGLSAGTAVAVGAAGAFALLVLYLVGRRAVRVVVPFAGPWLASPTTRIAGRWGRRVRWVASLVLQLAILSALVLAATDWARRDDESGGTGVAAPGQRGASSGATKGRTVALLLDRSASMQATDEPGSRLFRARALAREMVATLAPEDRAVIVSFATGATAHTGLESDPARLLAGIDDVHAGDEPGDLATALDFAATLLRDRPHPTIILFGDGGGSASSSAAVSEVLRDVELRYVPVGQRARNLAIVAFSARRQPGDPSSADVSLVVQSFQEASADIELVVSSGPEGVPIARRRLHLPGRARQAQALSGVPVPDARLEAHLIGGGDDLPLDDRAFAVVPAAPPLSVLVVGAPDLYLDGALLSLGGAAQVERMPPALVESGGSRLAAADVVIWHGLTPPPEVLRFDAPLDPAAPAARPGPGVLYLDPAGPHSPWREHSPRREVRDPIVAHVVRDHPLMRGLSLVDLNVLGARRLEPARDDTVVAATADNVPLLIARDRPGVRAVALAFDPRRSDLPLRSAFPLLLANTLTWLAQRSEPAGLSSTTGHTATVDVPGPALRSYDVRAPNGSRTAAIPTAGGVRLTLDRAGIYAVTGTAARPLAHIAANLASADESDLTPRPSVHIGDRAFLPMGPASVPAPGKRPRLPALALLVALALCTGEWLAHHRRVTV